MEAKIDLKAILLYLRDQKQIPGKGVYLTSIKAGGEFIEGGEFQKLDLWTALQDKLDGDVKRVSIEPAKEPVVGSPRVGKIRKKRIDSCRHHLRPVVSDRDSRLC